jgi:hypothetical protein
MEGPVMERPSRYSLEMVAQVAVRRAEDQALLVRGEGGGAKMGHRGTPHCLTIRGS